MLTKIEMKTLAFLASYSAQHRMGPTYPEIAEAIGLPSKYSAVSLVAKLEVEGYVVRTGKTVRSLKVLDDVEGRPIQYLRKMGIDFPLLPVEREEVVLDFVKDRISKTGRPPLLKEISQHFGIDRRNSVPKILDGLEKSGKIKRTENRYRNIELAEEVA